MRKHGHPLRRFMDDEEGQAVVEYVLMLATSIAIVAILASGLRRSLLTLWVFFAKQISAACPGCPPDPSVRL